MVIDMDNMMYVYNVVVYQLFDITVVSKPYDEISNHFQQIRYADKSNTCMHTHIQPAHKIMTLAPPIGHNSTHPQHKTICVCIDTYM